MEGGLLSAGRCLRERTPGVVAAVLKPSMVGGPEVALTLADIAFHHGLQASAVLVACITSHAADQSQDLLRIEFFFSKQELGFVHLPFRL